MFSHRKEIVTLQCLIRYNKRAVSIFTVHFLAAVINQEHNYSISSNGFKKIRKAF